MKTLLVSSVLLFLTASVLAQTKMLKPNGQVVMIDFQKRELPVGPPVEMKVAREDLIAQIRANGFDLLKEHTFLPYQYFLVFTQAARALE